MYGHALDFVDEWHVFKLANGCLPTLTERDFIAVRACGCVAEGYTVQIYFSFGHTDKLHYHLSIFVPVSGANINKIKVCGGFLLVTETCRHPYLDIISYHRH